MISSISETRSKLNTGNFQTFRHVYLVTFLQLRLCVYVYMCTHTHTHTHRLTVG